MGSYFPKHQIKWQRESRWNTETQSWQTEPTKITLADWIEEGIQRNKENIKIKEREGDILVPGDDEKGFGILWNFYLIRGEDEFLERKKAGWTPEKMKVDLDLKRKISEIKKKQAHLKYDIKWRALCVACKILTKNGQEGKDAAKELIRLYRINNRG